MLSSVHFTACFLVLYFFFSFTDGVFSPLDPDYVPEMELSMANVIREHLDKNPTSLAKMLKLIGELEERADGHWKNPVLDALALFKIVSGLVEEWKSIWEMMKEMDKEITLQEETEFHFPNPDDLYNVALSLFPIQDTYQITTEQLASGTFQGLNRSGGLSAKQCYDIGMAAFSIKDYYHALMWLHQAGINQENEDHPTISPIDIYPPYSLSLDYQGNLKDAIRVAVWLAELIRSEDEEDKQEIFGKYLQIKNMIDGWYDRREEIFRESLPPFLNERPKLTREKRVYEAVCRNALIQNKQDNLVNPKLKCFYEKDTTLLKLAPFKVEVINQNPSIILYRQFLSRKEAKRIYELAKRELQDRKRESRRRVSNDNVTLGSQLSISIVTVPGMMEMTSGRRGMKIDKEDNGMRVVHFPIGGYAVPQESKEDWDMQLVHNKEKAIMTLQISEPEVGGNVVFPKFGISVKPSIGDAILWYSPSNIVYAHCPVLYGINCVASQRFQVGRSTSKI